MMDLLSGVFVAAGAFFFLGGTAGLLRFPDIYCRLHAITKADNLGLGFVVLGLSLQRVSWDERLQYLLIWLLALLGAATVCHLLARSCLRLGIDPVEGTPSGPEADPSGEGGR